MGHYTVPSHVFTNEGKAKTLDSSSQSLARIRFFIVGDDGR